MVKIHHRIEIYQSIGKSFLTKSIASLNSSTLHYIFSKETTIHRPLKFWSHYRPVSLSSRPSKGPSSRYTHTQSTTMSTSHSQKSTSEKGAIITMAKDQDAQSTTSTSTMATTKSMLKSICRPKRSSTAASTESIEEKTQRKLREAEARAVWAMSR